MRHTALPYKCQKVHPAVLLDFNMEHSAMSSGFVTRHPALLSGFIVREPAMPLSVIMSTYVAMYSAVVLGFVVGSG